MEKKISKNVVIDKLFDTLSTQLDEFIECRFNDLTNKYDNPKEGEDLHDLIRKHYWDIFYNLNALCDFTKESVKALLEDEETEDHS